MKTLRPLIPGISLSALAAISLCSCATTKPADYLAPGFSPAEVTSVAVLPMVDNRIDKRTRMDLAKAAKPWIKSMLKYKGYPHNFLTEPAPSPYPRSAATPPSPSWISNLPSGNDRWVLLMILNDSSSQLTFGSTGNAEVQGYLFDKSKGTVLWREQATGRCGQGGLIGMTMIGLMEVSAVQTATCQALNTLPSKK